MQEYKDGTFGDVQKGTELLKKLCDDIDELEKTEAVHFGTEDELAKKKAEGGFKNSVLKRLEALEKQQDTIELRVNEVLIHLGLCQDEVLRVKG